VQDNKSGTDSHRPAQEQEMSADQPHPNSPRIDRRDALLSALAAGGVALA